MLSIPFLGWATSILLLVNNVNGLPASNSEASSQPVVDLGYSKYQGLALSSGVNQFLGMRFAAPPVGDLRFRAPAEPLTTTGLQNATTVRCLPPHFLDTFNT
jgi:acetylcholinesterase